MKSFEKAAAQPASEKKPAEAKVERNLPPTLPGQAEALIKVKGKVTGLRPDMPYIKVSEAKTYISAKRQALIEQTKLADKSGFDFKARAKYLDQMSAESQALDKFEEQVIKRASGGKEAAREGKEKLVENPEYKEAQADEGEVSAAEKKAELAELKKRQAILNKQRDKFMRELKGLSAEQDVGTYYKKLEESKIPEAEFPHYFGKETPKTRTAELEASRRDINISEAKDKKRGLSEPFREVLDELDEVNEKIAGLERDVAFGESRRKPRSLREAA